MKWPVTIPHHYVHALFICFLLFFLSVGFLVYRDYGVSIDEYSQIELGRVNYERIVTGSRELSTNIDRYYGPAFEVILHVFSMATQPILHIDLMSSRHLGVFLYFALSVVFFYLFLLCVFDEPIYALLGVMLLAVSPRFFAEAFYNSKDIPFLSTAIILFYVLSQSLPLTVPSLIALTALSGFAIAIRPQGLLLMSICAVALLAGSRKPVRRKIHWVIWYVAGTVVTTILFFPILWDGVVPQFIAYMRASLNPVGVPTYYFGRYYTSPNIPWHYIPVLIAITSMLSVVLLCVAGLVWFGYSRVHHPWIGDRRQTLAGVMGLTVIGSLSAALLLHARTYDGWRHMYYIYPSMIGLAVYAVHELNLLAKRRGGRVRILWCIVVAGIIIDCVSSVGFMVRNHPHEYVYFNPLAGGYTRAKQNFDLDYWGISYKQLLEHLLTLPTPARVYIAEQFPYVQFVMIPVLQSRGFTIMDTSTTADLIVEINRYTKSVPGFGWTKIFAASVGGIDISSIYARNGYSGQIPGRDTHL